MNMKSSATRETRKTARKSQIQVAVMAGVSEPLVRLYELGGPDAVTDDRKRAALDRVYAHLATKDVG